MPTVFTVYFTKSFRIDSSSSAREASTARK